MAMLEQMMGKVQGRGGTPRGGRFQGGLREKACRVCNDSKHTTVTHCRSERLCFACFAPGHTRTECPAGGSMACTISETTETKLTEAGVVTADDQFNTDVVLIGCGGRRVMPKSAVYLQMEVYGCKIVVPTLVVQGQHDEMILGTNVIKHVLRQYKQCDAYWKAVSGPCPAGNTESELYLSMLAGLDRWRGGDVPYKIGTVRSNSAVCLEPGREYLLWGKLPKSAAVSPGSTVMTELTSCRSAPRAILVARMVTSLRQDRWIPLKLINTSDKPVLVRRNAKLADVFPCIALEDMDDVQTDALLTSCSLTTAPSGDVGCSAEDKLKSVGLSDLDLSSCGVTEQCKDKLTELVLHYNDIFSRHHLDCGEAKDFVHRIHLSDNRPFRIPFRRLAPKKCFFLRKSVRFLGHVVDEAGVSTDPSKIEGIMKMTSVDLMEADGVTPSARRVRSFLGMVNFYQHFVPNYSAIAKPLFSLLSGQKRKSKGKMMCKPRSQCRRLSAADWTSDMEKAFQTLKLSLAESVVLAHPDFTRPLILSVDASLDGIGAVLSQMEEGENRARPIAFASKSLSQSQRNYPAHRLEFLALKWAGVTCGSVQDGFRSSRHCISQQGDGHSEIISAPLLVHAQCIGVDEVSAVLQSHTEWETGARARAAAALHHVPQLVPGGQDSLPAYTEKELCDEQLKDRTLSRVLYYVERRRRPTRRERARESVLVLRYLKHWEKLVLSSGILYRISRDLVTKFKRHQYVVPESLKAAVLKGVHSDAGHQGQSRSVGLARQRFFWLSLDRDVRDHVRNCKRCILVCIDFWSAEDVRNKTVDVLVVTDHFTRMAQAFPCKDQSAKQVARVLWDKFFCVFRFPERIHSDQGANFESELITELLRVSGIRKSHTIPYHPMGNGSVERFNRTLGNMIRALAPDIKATWPRRLQTLTLMYNSTIHETTGYAPFYLMFGRTPRLPIDVLFHAVLNDPAVVSYDKYVASLEKDLKDAMLIAQEHAKKEQHRQTELYNRRARGPTIDIGDRVLVANKKERGKRKVADRWESTVYTVVGRNVETHTYKICDTTTGQERVVHRNLLMLVNFLPVEDVSVLSDPVPSLSTSQLSGPSDVPASAVGRGSSQEGMSAVSGLSSRLGSQDTQEGRVQNESVGGEVVAVPEPADLVRRTVEWIALSPFPDCPHVGSVDSDGIASVSLVSDNDPEMSEDHSIAPDGGPVSVNDMGVDVADSNTERLTVSCDSDTHTFTQTDGQTVTTHGDSASDIRSTDTQRGTVVSAVNRENPSLSTRVRSRIGRIIKPVNRLIHIMSG
ncbi:Transposon Ty3-I Gag-Pol polyprotein [Merluccius polli]|uniref:Gypsy retrotransposon integrase-like protein 1 n=1 Tax=Merluccius polli TaxID=89951 RepID=A0AA47M7F4_MERPO|nr:Transposon Ty3-I Gag-Pol polyprotein [Merluccius polli]